MTSQTGQQIVAIRIMSNIQKEPSRDVLKKRCSENMHQIYGRTSMPKRDFNKFAERLYWNQTLLKEKLVPDPFVNIKAESISGLAVWNVIKFAFIACPRQSLSKCFKTKVVTICFYLIYSLFKTQKVIWN